MITRDIGITLGDPSGIGPEIVARALHEADALRGRARLFGDRAVIEDGFARVGLTLPDDLAIEDRGVIARGEIRAGEPCEAGARAQVDYLEAAARAAGDGEIDALVTAPISKSQAARAGFGFPGHTEFLADRLAGGSDVAMMFAGPTLRVVLATVHVGLAEVSAMLTPDVVAHRIGQLAEALVYDFAVEEPRIGVVGFNPHAGEGGMFGDEEARAIAPGIAKVADALGDLIRLDGPLVPDAAFRQAAEGRYDGLVAMYHDQGLIAVKLVDFEQTVNVTLGLPIVRTSPDHGTAYDIAGAGVARADSFSAALRMAAEIADRRRRERARIAP
jgi:4-hydroxythreonine-4-phosphate dehydrogenase